MKCSSTRVAVSLSAFAACIAIFALRQTCHRHLKKIVFFLVLCFILTSAVLLTAIGNAQRDQYVYQNDIVYKDLGTDILQLYKNNGLKNIYVSSMVEPICTSLQILENKYGFLKQDQAMSIAMFFMQKYLAYVPINYVLKAHIQQEPDLSHILPVIDKPNYFIKEAAPGTFVVTLKAVPAIPFSYDRWRE